LTTVLDQDITQKVVCLIMLSSTSSHSSSHSAHDDVSPSRPEGSSGMYRVPCTHHRPSSSGLFVPPSGIRKVREFRNRYSLIWYQVPGMISNKERALVIEYRFRRSYSLTGTRTRFLYFYRGLYRNFQLSRSRASRMEWGKGWKGSTIVLTVLKCTEH
jgi:hypothetical protein